MKKYFKFIQISFKNGLAYRAEYFIGVFRSLVVLLVQLCVWRALLGHTGQVTTNSGIVTLKEMTTYVLVSSMISTMVNYNVIQDMNNRIGTGQISMDLVKPMNFQTYTFCNMTGQNMFSFLFQLLPILVIGLIFVGIDFPTLQNLLLFCLALINAVVIMFLMNYCLGLMAFWYTRTWQVSELLQMFIRLFSGMIVPLWFFPKVLMNIADFLPFKLTYFVPISVFMGKGTFVDSLWSLLQQFGWMAVLYLLTKLVWRTAIKKLVIQGG
jgi:ABC-2 type transport system permease protein